MIRPAVAEELDKVGALVAHAFEELPHARSLVPDDTRRRAALAAYVTHRARTADTIDVIDGPLGAPAAAAIWFTSRTPPAPAPEADPFGEAECLLERHRPPEPHRHLAFLAVHPDHQHAGLGHALLEHALGRQGRAPAYTTAINADTVRFYRELGFEPLQPFVLRLHTGTPFYRLQHPCDPPLTITAAHTYRLPAASRS
jgi:GNAT superfamily N-acetyltransferase